MTQNQIAYWKLQEDIRNNKAQLAEVYRHNAATEFIQTGTLGETKRHNLATEGVAFGTLQETGRHNIAMEDENERSNKAREALTHESNVYNREVGMANVSEMRRHNEAYEQETARHNQAYEEETARHNQAGEAFSYYQADKDYSIKSEQNRLREEEMYGGSKVKSYDSRGFSGGGKGTSSESGKKTWERQYQEQQLEQGQTKLNQGWFNIGIDAIEGATRIVKGLDFVLPSLIK